MLGQLLKALIQRQHMHIFMIAHGTEFIVECHIAIVSTFSRLMNSRIVNQNLPHKHGCQSHEVSPVLRPERTLFHEPKVSLVHEGGGLQSVVRALSTKVAVSQTVQFVVDERN